MALLTAGTLCLDGTRRVFGFERTTRSALLVRNSDVSADTGRRGPLLELLRAVMQGAPSVDLALISVASVQRFPKIGVGVRERDLATGPSATRLLEDTLLQKLLNPPPPPPGRSKAQTFPR